MFLHRLLLSFVLLISTLTSIYVHAFSLQELKIHEMGSYLAYPLKNDPAVYSREKSGSLAGICDTLEVNGIRGWRLPTKAEIKAMNDVTSGMFTLDTATNPRTGNTEHLNFSSDGSSGFVGGQTVCITDMNSVKNPIPVAQPTKEHQGARITLTTSSNAEADAVERANDAKKKSAEFEAQHKKVLAEKAATAKAAAEAANKVREDLQRQSCLTPEMKGKCSCLKYQPTSSVIGNACGK